MAVLTLLSLAFAYAVFQKGGVWPRDWNVFLLVPGVLSLCCWFRARRPEMAPHPEGGTRWALMLLPAYVVFQLVPLPLGMVRLLSPARAELHEALAQQVAVGMYTPLSVVPAAGFEHFIRIAGYVLVFLLIRELAYRLPERPWALALPVVVVAALEATLGLVQYYTPGTEGLARGTYVNRNHFAGLLGMALPFAVMYAVAVLRRNRTPHHSPARPALIACATLGLAALILVGIIHSLSRMGFIAALVSLFVMGALALGAGQRAWRRWVPVSVVAAVVVIGFLYLPPNELIQRFGELAASEDVSAATRAQIWRESLRLVKAFPVFGCGLGGYHSAFFRYKEVAPAQTVDFAHNDYLQYLAELGVAGFALAVAGVAAVWASALRAASAHAEADGRALAVACAGALTAILMHSLTDFNLYIPANAALLAWIAGISSGLMFSSHPGRGSSRVVEVKPGSGLVVL